MDLKRIPFPDNDDDFRIVYNQFMELATLYHKESESDEFTFNYRGFVTEWQSGDLILWFGYENDEPIGFVIGHIAGELFSKQLTLEILHAFINKDKRGNIMFIKEAVGHMRKVQAEHGCDRMIIVSDVELVPLFLKIGGAGVRYSAVEFGEAT